VKFLSYFCPTLPVILVLLVVLCVRRMCNLHIPRDPHVFDSHSLPPWRVDCASTTHFFADLGWFQGGSQCLEAEAAASGS